jgi:hypothetical protein
MSEIAGNEVESPIDDQQVRCEDDGGFEFFWEAVKDVAVSFSEKLYYFVFSALFLCAGVDLLWRAWNKVSITFPLWHLPTTSLHQFSWIFGFIVGGVILLRWSFSFSKEFFRSHY